MAEIRYKKEEWKKKMKIKLDVNNMFTEQVGAEHGIKKEDIDKLQDDLLKAHKAIKRARKAGELGFMELPETQKEVAKDIKELVATKKDDFDNFVVLGIGGSALGAIALQTALNHPYYNLNDDARGDGLRLFVPDNVDPARLEGLLETLDLERTLFNVISKSGGTAETMSQFLIARNLVAEELGEDKVAKHFIATTSQDTGNLIKIAKKEGMDTFYIPDNVGGRFSVLTPVGLVPAAFCGIDIEELLAGAEYMDQICDNEDLWQNPAYLNATLQYLADKDGKSMSVMMPYVHALKDIADWYRQLWAESLGKEEDRSGKVVNVGPTPIKALGATDQHSQVQLYMEGPYDKVITFLTVDNYQAEIKIPEEYRNIKGVSYLGGHTLNQLIKTEQSATELALTKNGRLNCTINLPEVNEFTMGQLLYMFELQTAFAGELYNINAFNQPGVELGKNYTYGILGREGYENMKEEYESKPAKNNNLII
ncbi:MULTISPECIES: glucose-6-phosphate isomerase [unclassified Candidatus Frackibacter]|uniref:glucose-6-phosphate isomerase n=1 Tax=unclassified Candidatus Frackibacter TaxID=2648818 RepID=UPI0007964BF5|nr:MULTISPECIES: glucose-6-phosphate isomerase [unclassified Candidatus Frackibacter]KXS40632.1 MAG: glucose-6-phosphate isomerase [Candidatus Frackibacter sp. T328-2]SDC15584.1 glucose-6-phosphate isomerase [Candidatus Frackibacter sp. WG11]SEM46077.1 glucose-6-phosphate isomerase [Candidatus Frackibacter sp. WG12]SFL48209.1 glucose-6-phosphate isomerase [Candidatus Frackibacter sp. WG13]